MIAILVSSFIAITGTDNQIVWVNPSQVVSIREPRGISGGHWPAGTKCLVLTADQKYFTSTEPCPQLERKLRQ